MTILGISCYFHDSAAVIIKDGVVISAAEEERFSRKKHDSDFPKRAIDFCLSEAGVTAHHLDYVVFYEKPFLKFTRIIQSGLGVYPRGYKQFREAMIQWLTKKLWIKETISSSLGISTDKILFCPHHVSHAASCFYPSPFTRSAILTVDGVGEWTTTAYGTGNGRTIRLLKEIRYPHSIGLLYSTFTAFLGFEVNDGEWKVMGLAPYGKPRYADLVRKLITFNADGSFSLDLRYFSFHYSDTKSYSDRFISLFGFPVAKESSHIITERSADISASIQKVTEELLVHMATFIQKSTGEKNLCYAGGVALNSVANTSLLTACGYENVFIQPAAGDSGGALGAALYASALVDRQYKRSVQNTSYFGKAYTNAHIESFLSKNKIRARSVDDKTLIDFATKQLMKNKIIGWFQGKFEWGPRALGNRSILADARNKDMKEIINSKVKFREAFRPFAPSVLARHAHRVFELPKYPEKHIPLRFMLYVVPVRKNWQKRVPAITHVDDTARPQLVYRGDNPLYYRLINDFYKKTGVPLILNTSFNLRGEPIVESPADAYSTFVRSGIDILIMGKYILTKE